MQKWEYTQALNDGSCDGVRGEDGDFITFTQPPTGIFRSTKGVYKLSDWLNKMGEDGWEIASMVAYGQNNSQFIILKRPKE